MFGFDLLGLPEPADALAPAPPSLHVPTILLVWIAALGVAYAICYTYMAATPMTQYPRAVWAVAYLFIPLPPIIAAVQCTRRVLQQGAGPPL